MLSISVCNLDGEVLVPVLERRQTSIDVALNGQRFAKFRVSVEDAAAAAIAPLKTLVKVKLGTSLLFNGPILTAPLEDEALSVSAVDPSHRLARAYVNGLAPFEDEDQSEILAQLVEHADASASELADDVRSHGIIRGTLPATRDRKRDYPDGKNIWEALVEMSEVIGGPDFELEPLDRTDGVVAQLNTAQRLGTDRTSQIRFEHAFGIDNVSELRPEESGEIINRAIVAGKSRKGKKPDAWKAELRDSMRAYGIHESFEVASDIKEIQTLRDHAEAVVAASAYPLTFFTLTPRVEDSEGVPAFGPDGDYWVGDTIGVESRQGLVERSLTGRITDATISEVEATGEVQVALTCEPHLISGGITGEKIAVKTDSE